MHRILIFLFISTTTAIQVGYNYRSPGQTITINSANGGDAGGGGNFGGGGLVGDSKRTTTNRYTSTEPTGRIVNGISSGSNGFISDNGAFSSANNNNNHALEIVSPHLEYNKEFYSFIAPEENFNEISDAQFSTNNIKKNLRVIFIRAPENQALTNAALQLIQQTSHDRTAIYVLTKQTDVGELANKLKILQHHNVAKPEVHFVKYRTQEDALRAQQAIRAQYNSIGGSANSLNEQHVAPVLNFDSSSFDSNPIISPRITSHHQQSSTLSSTASSDSSASTIGVSSSFGSGDATNNKYLPGPLKLQ